MEMQVRPATWLEMVQSPQGRGASRNVRIHPVAGVKGACYALTLDKRWLCGTDGSVTLFRSLGSAVRFLQLAKVDDFEAGDPADIGLTVGDSVQCLCISKGMNLQACRHRGPGCPSEVPRSS